jgi:hypothetical protein
MSSSTACGQDLITCPGYTEQVTRDPSNNMRQQEIANYSNAQITGSDLIELCPKDINNINSYKTRSGKIGDYINYLSKKDIEKIDRIINSYRG